MINIDQIFEKLQNGEPLEQYEIDLIKRKFEDFNGIQHAVIDLLREVDKEFIKLESEIRYYKRLARRKIKRVI